MSAAVLIALASCGAPKPGASQAKPAAGQGQDGGKGSDQKGGDDKGGKSPAQKGGDDKGGGQKDDKGQGGGGSDDKGGGGKPKDPRAMARFPQPVLAGVLAGRWLIAPEESQPVLGTVTGVVRDAKGDDQLVVRTGGVAGIDPRWVLVAASDAALLNQKVALVDEEVDDFRKAPAYRQGSLPPVKPQETIRMGIVKPFH